MKRNVGKTDKIIRILIAVVLAGLYFTNAISGTIGIVFLIVAGIALVTALVNFCGLYALFGLSSCPLKKEKSE